MNEDALKIAAEALVGVTGVFPQDGPVTREQGRRAERVAKEWRAAVDAWLDQKEPADFKWVKPPDHEKTLEDLTSGITADRGAELVSLLVVPELADAYLQHLSDAREYLRALWPAFELDTPRGPRLVVPGKIERGRVASLLAVVDDPERVLDEMRMGTLTYPQADAFRRVYPRLHEMLVAMIREALALKPKAYVMPWWQERVYRVLLDLKPSMSLSRVEQPPPRAANPNISVDTKAEKLQTRAQVLAQR